MRTEPVMVIATRTCIAVEWAAKHLVSFEMRPTCVGFDSNVENLLRGSRGRLIVLVDIPDLGPYQYCGSKNTIINIQ